MRPFVGSNVFVSRNLVAPELFDAVLDALKIGGAEVFLCCDPSRNGPDDFHVISSAEHEKFEDLRAKGCNLIGPQCVLSCAKERRPLPKQGFTCCLAMDGIKVIASGFDAEERGKVVKYVMAMGGILLTRMSSDVNFVVVKDVRAAKYKSAVQAKKPLVNISWLYHCWSEHRVVPQDSYRVPPFAGLVICVTRISAACLNEEDFPVSGKSVSSLDAIKGRLALKNSQDKNAGNCQSVQSSFVSDSKFRCFSSSMVGDSDLDATLSQTFSSAVSNDSVFAEKAETDEDDLYLSDCRICLVGFDAIDVRKLVNLIRRGGGSRFVAYSQRLTHIVVGCPSDVEKRDIRGLAALGVIHVVKGVWLEECDRRKKEIPVTQRHIAHDILHPQDSVGASKKVSGTSVSSLKQEACSTVPSGIQTAISEVNGEVPMMSDKGREGKPVTGMSSCYLPKGTKESLQKCLLPVSNDMNMSQKHQLDGCSRNPKSKMSVAVFIGMKFHFSEFFSQARRDEVVEWINEGRGEISDGQMKENVNFIVESHGVQPPLVGSSRATYVSTHWIRSCLEKHSLSHKKEGSVVRAKGNSLEKAFRELEKMVAESRPPTSDVQDANASSQAIKRRLPREIKLKLAKVARLSSSQGKVPEDLLHRLMSILGHLMQLRTLKIYVNIYFNH
ncbi:Ubinuclein-1-like protein [Drosera capensis]